MRSGVLATSVPKTVVVEFLEKLEAARDVFTVLQFGEFGDCCDMVVYRDPLPPHELASGVSKNVLDGICATHGMCLSSYHLLLALRC